MNSIKRFVFLVRGFFMILLPLQAIQPSLPAEIQIK